MKKFAIIGGGIGGLTLAVAMQRKGLDVQVYESAPRFKPLGAGLALAANAMMAFNEIGIAEDVIRVGLKIKKAYGCDLKGRTISYMDAEKLTEQYGIVNNFTIHRADLHEVLIRLVKPDTVMNGKSCVDVEPDGNGVRITFSDGSMAAADYLIACDGVHSVVRRKLLPESVPRYAGYTCWRAVVNNLPEGFNFEKVTETWGSGRRFGVVPLSNRRVYWFATLNAKHNDTAMRLANSNEILRYFKNFHDPIPEILKRTQDVQVIWSDIIDVKPIRQFAFGKILLMGDAAHATTPNLGQGACMAIEDAATLANGLVKYPAAEAFRKFEMHRIQRTTSIVNQSWNFGRIAQAENPLLIWLRNTAMRHVPQRTIDKQLKALYDVSFHC